MEEKIGEPLITVGIPTYNRCELLKRCLDSIVNQTYKNLEIIVSDNFSTDGTEVFMNDFIKKDPRIKYFRQKKNMGIGWQSAFINKLVTGEYYILICDDDWIDLDFIEKCYAYLIAHPDVFFCRGSVVLYDTDYNIIKDYGSVYFTQDSYEDRIQSYILNSNFIDNTSLQKKEFSDAFFAPVCFCQDQIAVVQKLLIGKFACLDSVHYHKLHNGVSRDLESVKQNFKDFPQDCKTYEGFVFNLAKAYVSAVMNNDFFVERLSIEQRQTLKLAVIEAFKKRFFLVCHYYDFMNYFKNRKLPLFRFGFYKLLFANVKYRIKFRCLEGERVL